MGTRRHELPTEIVFHIHLSNQRRRVFLHIELTKAIPKEKPIVQNLSQFYLYEFSKCTPAIKLEGNIGLYDGLPDLDGYWDTPNREPFIIRVNRELAGFVLAIKGTFNSPNQIGEFFVMKKFCGKGVGRQWPEEFLICFPATGSFMKCGIIIMLKRFGVVIVNSYTDGKYQEYYDEHRRPFQKFSTHKS